MCSLQEPVICPAVQAKQTGVYTVPINGPLIKDKVLRSAYWGFRAIKAARVNLSHQLHRQQCMKVRCSYSSLSNGNGSREENTNENDEDYVNSSVIEAVEMKSGPDGFMIRMRDGMNLRCVHNNPQGGHLPDNATNPAIVLKMEDGTGLLLPIIVLELPSVLLVEAICNVHIARPTIYEIVKEMVDKMEYAVKFVRVTKIVHETYFAQLCLTNLGNETECIGFDLRPSDAINIAVRCKAPIQVNKHLAFSEGMRVIESSPVPRDTSFSDGLLFTELDQPTSQPCIETEFNLMRNMRDAVVEERYKDAAELKYKLTQLRSKKKWA